MSASLLLVFLPASKHFHADDEPARRLPGHGRPPARRFASSAATLVGSLLFFAFLGLFTYLPFHLAGPPYNFSPSADRPRVFGLRRGGRFVAAGRALGAAFSVLANSCRGAFRDASRRPAHRCAEQPPSSSCALLLLCFANFVVQSTATAFVAATAEHDRAGANALYLFFYYVGGSLGGYLPGLLWPLYGWAGVLALTVTSLAFALVTVALTLCRR